MRGKKRNSHKKSVSKAVTTAMVASIVAPVAAPAVQAAGSFSDVNSDAFYAEAVNELASKGIIGGYSDGTYQPNKQVTRAEAAKILAFDLGLTSNVGAAKFSDVKGRDWFYQPVTALAEVGGINGYQDGTFQPNKTITRAEMASLIVKAYGLKAEESVTTPFTDVASNSWYAGAVKTLYANKVTSGKGSVSTFGPNDSVTRGEMAVFVQRASLLKSGATPVVLGDVIEDISENGIVIGGATYTANESVKGILGVHNAAILKGAKIDFEESNGVINKIKTLQLSASGTSSTVEFANNLTLDGKGNSVGELLIDGNYITVKDLSVENDLTISQKLMNDFFGEKVIVKGKTIVYGGDDNTVVFKDSNLGDVELNKTGVHFDAKGSTSVGTISVLKDAKISSGKTISKVKVEKGVKLSLGNDINIDNIELADGEKLKDVVTSNVQRKNIKKVNGSSNSEYGTSIGGGGSSSSSNSDDSNDSVDNGSISFGQVISTAGTYGPTSGVKTIDGDLEITTANVKLQNLVIKGDLILGEGIGEGEVYLKGVKVEGQTIVNGGGQNSIYFEDSVLATVIVNKNTGAVRIVAQGSTQVFEVQLETPVIVEERNLDSGADGFTNITVPESYQSRLGVELVGTFETINSRATNVRIQLSEQTDIRTLVLNAAAEVLGGRINTAMINANGSTLSSRPQNVVLDIGTRTNVGGEEITDSYSAAEEASITSISANQYSISLDFEPFIVGLTKDDFKVNATLGGEAYELSNLQYDSVKNRFTYDSVPLTGNIGKELVITIGPADVNDSGDNIKVIGEAKTTTVEIKAGFGGRITDIQEVGVEGARIKFRAGTGTREGSIVGEAITDKYGYYSINLPAGSYTGEIEKQGYVTTYVLGTSASDTYLKDQNEIAIRAAASEEIKIMLTWGEEPSDLDSHLTGPTAGQEDWFHTNYYDDVYQNDGVTYVDLDWDDVTSYGPETTTIRNLVDGKYIFFVHHYSGYSTIRQSGAKVQIYKGNSIIADKEINVTTGEDNEYHWVVFSFDVSNDGENVEITEINYLTDFAHPDDDGIPEEVEQFRNPRQAIEQKLEYARGINTVETTLAEEYVTSLENAIEAGAAILGNQSATQAELYEKLIQLLDAIEPFRDGQISIEAELENVYYDLYYSILGTNSDFDDVTNNLTLPTAGEHETTISWESSNEDVIKTDGSVTRPTEGSTEVTLTATISKGGVSLVREFDITVLAVESDESDGTTTEDTISISLVDGGTEGSLTTGDTIKFEFSNPVTESTSSDTIKVRFTTGDTIEVYDENEEVMLLELSIIGADYVGDGPVIFNGSASINGNIFEIRLEELEAGEENLLIHEDANPNFEVIGGFEGEEEIYQ